MTWLRIKVVLGKAWIWIKFHWELVLGVVLGLLVMLSFRKGTPDFAGLYQKIIEKQHDESDKLQKAYKRDYERRQASDIRASEAMRKIEKDYAEKRKEFDVKSRREVNKVIQSAKNDPELLSREMARLLGADFKQ